ncbi:unnamed protein product [Notodromas monacha]|uniref:UDP-N-acetylglucosamine 4-epimerase n=1 Tax=Notodromas monacha TaxID=399045 RepID=A0A7R9BH94_9CRUS|nr:unnamed protein product [Notodromas monacha]CAG0915450.1 unnamed protein product [Notodromas monacha]
MFGDLIMWLNLLGMLNLLEAMKEHKVQNLVFSGSCTVYGHPEKIPVSEEEVVGSVKNPYGRTKLYCEEIMQDVVQAHPEFNMISLRYFNPIGAHPSGEMGEDPKKINANIVPFLGEVAIGHAEKFTVFGDDYDTPDGTCIRDYTHIMDLAEGHVLAMKKLENERVGWRAYNLGIGKGLSVKEIIDAFEEASGRKIKTAVVERRPFNIDAPKVMADPGRAMAELDYVPKCTDPVQMCCNTNQPFEECIEKVLQKNLAMSESKTVLLTGGAGYIGSHCALVLLQHGYNVVVVDNLANSFGSEDGTRAFSLDRVQKLTGKPIAFHNVDLCNRNELFKIFDEHSIDAVIHFAGHKSVQRSLYQPFDYYENNIMALLNLLRAMEAHKVRNIVFSGSSTVYGQTGKVPVNEDDHIGARNPYGRTKLFCEQIMQDVLRAYPEFNMISLRYFNPIGAHESGEIGEDSKKPCVNILPCLAEAAIGHVETFAILGNDYDTPDGTCIRDYTHVMDLADGHVLAMKKLENEHLGWDVFNMGIGRGISVKELVDAFQEASGKKINAVIGERRPFQIDAPKMFTDPSKAIRELGYKPKCTDPVEMCT